MRLKNGLRRRFVFTLIGVVTVILVIFSGIVIGYNYKKMEAELTQQLQRTLTLAETALPEAVWRGDQSAISNISRAIFANDTVIYARVSIGEKVVISRIRPKYSGKSIDDFQNSTDFLISSASIERQGVTIGTLQVVMSRAEIYSEILSTAFSVIGLLLILVLAILFTSLLVLRYYLFRPLAKLERSANLIAAGNLDTEIDIDSRGEIASLAAAFKLMANRLQESFTTLEKKVVERTVDLSQAKIAAEETSQHLLFVSAELQALLDNSPVGIVYIDTHGVIKRVNSEMEKIVGYSGTELVGEMTAMLCAVGASGGSGQNSPVKNFPKLTKDEFSEKRVALIKKDGSEIICLLRGRSIPGSNELEGDIWSVEDITQRLQMEQELLEAKKQESIGVLAGGIAHDFNNILFAVIGNLSLAERLTDDGAPAKEHIRSAQKASVRAKELTGKLLTFARGGELIKSMVSLPELVREAAGFILSGSNVKCVLEIPENLWSVSMDKNQISQVVQDLVQNANQSMPKGGRILINFANVELADGERVGLRPGRYVRVKMTDKGRGIKGEILDRVFDPYFSTKEKDSTKGSGLGLAIVHSIVVKHNGMISVDSSPGQGTTFTLHLPARRVLVEDDSAKAAIVMSGKGVVLILSGDGKDHLLVADMLSHIGYRSQAVFTIQDGLKLYSDGLAGGTRFCAVIVDSSISWDLVEQELIGKLLDLDPQAVIICGSDGSEKSESGALDGCMGRLEKPYNLLELNRLMSSLQKKE